jgi:putative oxidoreductase
MLKKFFETNCDSAATILRLTLGIVMFAHGAGKALGWFGGYGFSGTLAGMTGMGLPWIIAFLVIVIEFLGSIFLILGFATRLAALGMIAVMLGAIATVHYKNGFFMNWSGHQPGEGFEYHLLVIGMALALLVRGGGAISLDKKIAQCCETHCHKES